MCSGKTSFIFFDLGGVVIKDFSGTSLWDSMLTDIGLNLTDKETFQKEWKLHEQEFCIDYPCDNVVETLKKQGIHVHVQQSLLYKFVCRLETNSSIWQIVRAVKTV